MIKTARRDPHILLVISSLSAGGAERVLAEMANWWADHGRRVTVLTLSGVDQDHYTLNPGVGRIALNYWGKSLNPWKIIDKRVRRILKLRRAVLSTAPDLVVSFMDTTNVRTLTALVGTGIPVVVSERTDPRCNPVGRFWVVSRRLLYPLSKALVVQTEPVAQWAREVVPSCRVAVIPNFVRSLPEREPAERDTSLILSVGRLGIEKGHDLLIRAFAEAGGAQKGWHLTILGEGGERGNLEDLAARLGLGGSVSLPGTVREPAEWMRRAAVFALPSRFEGFPNALLEAMACGCAVIAADCPSAPALIVRNGTNGLLVPAEHVTALSSGLERLMADEKLRLRLGAEARGVKEDYAQEAVMSRWDTLVEKVFSEGGTGNE